VAVLVAVGVAVGVTEAVGVFEAVGVEDGVGVFVGVLVAAATVNDVLAVTSGALTAKASTTFVKDPTVVGLAVAVTVMTTLPPIGMLAISTSRLDALKVTSPDVLVTFWIASQAGKSSSVTRTPRAPNVPLFVTVIV
jgi:hypothetical protein